MLIVGLAQDKELTRSLCAWGSDTSRSGAVDFITSWGNPLPVTLLAVVSACVALLRREVMAATTLLAVPYAAALSCSLLKELVERQRPGLACSAAAEGFSFPSGHAVSTTTGFILVALFLSRFLRAPAAHLVLVLAVVCSELVALSRVLLGVHYSVDVLAGQLLGGLWLLLGIVLLGQRRKLRTPEKLRADKSRSAA